MEIFDAPNLDDRRKSPEENIRILKNYLSSMSETMNMYLTSYQSRIEALERQIKEMGEKIDGK